ncbi:hypothetical protein MKW92_025904 [Papaver armeniacum]|nr:hypothetical protein MKW92_025904 [Papaver armeniacum]
MAHMNNDQIGGVFAILSLSYNDLPLHLKPCFLYLGLFPEDYAIPTKKLIQLWIAEGFIPQMDNNSLVTMEDVGKHQYLKELSQRCMLKVDKSTKPGEGTTCRLHDLMRDLCLSKAKEVNFLDIYDQQHRIENRRSDSRSSDSYRRLRRYAFHLAKEQEERYECYFKNLDCALRTLLVDVPECFRTKPFNYQKIKLLRILDLESVTELNKNITKEVSKLVHLRYLALGGQPDTPISPSIGKLRNLQTLKLVNFGGCLPRTTSRMLQLRYLRLSDCCEVDQKFRVDNLINLHTLENIRAGKWIRSGCFQKLTNLRRLWINNLSELQAQVILTEVVAPRMASFSSVEQYYHNPIKSLELHCNERFPELTHSLTSCHNLRVLCLSGTLSFHENLFPPSLTKIYLQNNMLDEDPMESLQGLPNLTVLILYEAYVGACMKCSVYGFPRLQHLYLLKHSHLKNLSIDHRGMPCLKVLHISDCKELWKLPQGLQSITTLQDLLVISMPSRFNARLVKSEGADWYKIKHIPSIRVVDA